MVRFFIEVAVALALAIFIVWFTMGGKRKQPPAARSDDTGEHGDAG
jgi:hypothetical protein